MTDTASPDKPDAASDLARFFQDWTALWMGELQAQARETTPMSGPAPAEAWGAVMAQWVKGLGTKGLADDGPSAGPAGPPSAAAAFDPRDAQIERLARRVDELEARIARLEAPRRRRS